MKRLLWGYGSSSSYRCQRAGTRRILAAKRTNLVEKGNNKFVLGLQHYFTTTQSTTVGYDAKKKLLNGGLDDDQAALRNGRGMERRGTPPHCTTVQYQGRSSIPPSCGPTINRRVVWIKNSFLSLISSCMCVTTTKMFVPASIYFHSAAACVVK